MVLISSSETDLDAARALAARLQQIDWRAPWFDPYRARCLAWSSALQRGAEAWRALLSQQASSQGLHTAAAPSWLPGSTSTTSATRADRPTAPLPSSFPLHFVPQHALPAQSAYEAHIAATGAVPTRANLHDCFNAAQWFAFPALKAAMNAAQAGEIAAHGVQSKRGGRRDAWTLFDENGAIFACADPALSAALYRFDWRELLLARRPAWGAQCEVHLVGHALLEKLSAPYKAITAHVVVVEVDAAYFGWPASRRRAFLDTQLARRLGAWRDTRALTPLPVLGIPGWWAANADPAFYDDAQVFRSHRRDRP